MEDIKEIIDQIVQGCSQGGVEVSEILAAFVARTVVEDNASTFSLDRNATQAQTEEVVLQSIEKLLEKDSPALEMIKMQVDYDSTYLQEENEAQRKLKTRNKMISAHKLAIVEVEMDDASDYEALTTLYRKIFKFLLEFAPNSKTSDRAVEREIAAALESVFPRVGLKAFIQLNYEDKVTQLLELARIILGIRLFNRDEGRGGAGIDDMDKDANILANVLSQDIDREVDFFVDACAKYQKAIIKAHVQKRKHRHDEAEEERERSSKVAEADKTPQDLARDAAAAAKKTGSGDGGGGSGAYPTAAAGAGDAAKNPHPLQVTQVTDDMIERWSQELTNRRQYLGFLRTLQDEAKFLLEKISTICNNIRLELNNVRALVTHKTAIPKEIVYPRFDALGSLWLQLFEEVLTMIARSNTFQALCRYRLSFSPTLSEKFYLDAAAAGGEMSLAAAMEAAKKGKPVTSGQPSSGGSNGGGRDDGGSETGATGKTSATTPQRAAGASVSASGGESEVVHGTSSQGDMPPDSADSAGEGESTPSTPLPPSAGGTGDAGGAREGFSAPSSIEARVGTAADAGAEMDGSGVAAQTDTRTDEPGQGAASIGADAATDSADIGPSADTTADGAAKAGSGGGVETGTSAAAGKGSHGVATADAQSTADASTTTPDAGGNAGGGAGGDAGGGTSGRGSTVPKKHMVDTPPRTGSATPPGATAGRRQPVGAVQDSDDPENPYGLEEVSASGARLLSVHNTPDFMMLPLELQGYCPWTIVQARGLLIPGKPSLGIVRYDNMYYVFDHALSIKAFMDDPTKYLNAIRERALRHPEFINLLRLHKWFPTASIAKLLKIHEIEANNKTGQPLTKDASTSTPTHFTDSYIDINYHWNEWELRRRALKMVNLMHCATTEQQTDESHFRRDNDTQVYPHRIKGTQTKRDKGTNPPTITTYVAGLRGKQNMSDHKKAAIAAALEGGGPKTYTPGGGGGSSNQIVDGAVDVPFSLQYPQSGVVTLTLDDTFSAIHNIKVDR